ncbi:MAG: glucose-6-phosphate dehydrogenase [Anaerolineales bacterium]|nr:glucose-6-phosphate dehydrogenase [Anaerolineae bacterium]PWB52829.1 MAG: glucose-6-phosphate dehydrogenase [Anaerolineales bacterium]
MPDNDKLTSIIIFGASGDLTWRKLVPALYNNYIKGRMVKCDRIIGFARRPFTDESFSERLLEGVKTFSPESFDSQRWGEFSTKLIYFQGNLDAPDDFNRLGSFLSEQEGKPANRLYYLATAPEHYIPVVNCLGRAHLADQSEGWRRIIVEKPFGNDLSSARELNKILHSVFDESQIYRIDHYLGKETAQNILFFRFANTIFEPIWNRRYVDNIQITVSETVDIEHRADYYDSVGVLRDMFQNHLLQLLSLVAMEPPASFEADAVRNETFKLLSSIRPVALTDTVRAQYEGYRQTEGVATDSQTPTYAAVKLYIDNWRWKGVPFYLRSGKSLAQKTSQVIVEFQRPPHLMFHLPDEYQFIPNILALCIQPDEGIHLMFEAKVPDSDQDMRSVDMEFHYRDSFDCVLPDAYERLLMEALRGDASLFTRSDGIEAAWKLIDSITQGWEASNIPELSLYRRGSWGPSEAAALLARDSRSWRLGCVSD